MAALWLTGLFDPAGVALDRSAATRTQRVAPPQQEGATCRLCATRSLEPDVDGLCEECFLRVW